MPSGTLLSYAERLGGGDDSDSGGTTVPEEALTAEEQRFLCEAYREAGDDPRRQVGDYNLQQSFGTQEFLRLRDALARRGYLDLGGIERAVGGTSVGGFWITQAGANEAERVCGGEIR